MISASIHVGSKTSLGTSTTRGRNAPILLINFGTRSQKAIDGTRGITARLVLE